MKQIRKPYAYMVAFWFPRMRPWWKSFAQRREPLSEVRNFVFPLSEYNFRLQEVMINCDGYVFVSIRHSASDNKFLHVGCPSGFHRFPQEQIIIFESLQVAEIRCETYSGKPVNAHVALGGWRITDVYENFKHGDAIV